jgi:glycosyltransferase involved in cell wall biosynthesis
MNTSEKTPLFSVILAVQDQAGALHENLPRLLSSSDAAEQVVVDMSSTDNTDDVLSSLKVTYDNLYSTFVPKYHFQRNPRRLALTIGMKAAKGVWVVFADIDNLPPSESWLTELAELAVSPNVLLLGYMKRKTGQVRVKAYDDLSQASSLVMRTEQRRNDGSSRFFAFNSTLPSFTPDYDFIAVRADKGHGLLRLFESTKQRRL